MLRMIQNTEFGKKMAKDTLRRDQVRQRLLRGAGLTPQELLQEMQIPETGLDEERVETAREEFGDNHVTHGKKISVLKRVVDSFVNPFTGILFALAVVSTFTDIILAEPDEVNPMTVIIIAVMVLVSGGLRFVQEIRSGNAAENLLKMIKTTTCVVRAETGKQEIQLDEVVVGDVVYLSAGDMVPADIRILEAKDLFINQSALTGESESMEKVAAASTGEEGILEKHNLAFMGTNIISGSGAALVLATGNDTVFGDMASHMNDAPVQTSFEKGVNSVSWLLIRFMLVMIPIVLFVNGFTKGDWMSAVLFAISIAVGLTPEMLPMIVTTCLSKGAVAMSREKTIIKNLNSIQNLGAMDVLCTDKTGTLTADKVFLEYHMNINGKEDVRVLRHAFLNSYYQTGLKNLIDVAIIEKTEEESLQVDILRGISTHYIKVDEIPFDFVRRRMSVVVCDKNGKRQMITKGAIEEMLEVSSFVEYEGAVQELTDELREYVRKKVDALNDDGFRVIGVAQKTNPSPVGAFSVADEADMVLIGYLAFLDPPKASAVGAIEALHEYGVGIKVLTGDNDRVTKAICKKVGIPVERILLGTDVEGMSQENLSKEVEQVDVFAKLSPLQKARVVETLRANGHVVGYMGDGINDAAAMKASDVGISVDTAVDIAKESAHVILLEKDLMVLEKGIIEGRKTYANMIKYIKMTASSNFGNMFSVLIASAFLPFLPMASIQLLLLNLIYDLSCTAIPWDNVDEEFLKQPKHWDASNIGKFMIWFGPTSSVFDIATYLIMYFVITPMLCGGLHFHQITDPGMQDQFIAIFQTGWFVESMWTQSLVIHLIRTQKIPFIQSRASASVSLLTMAGIGVLTLIPYTPVAASIGLSPLPAVYFGVLGVTVLLYMLLVTVFKKFFIKRYGSLL